VGLDINDRYVQTARRIARERFPEAETELRVADFFHFDWEDLLDRLPEPLLIIGNPPWVTHSELKRLQSANLPERRNTGGLKGLDAVTGKSNFDISEWMFQRMLEWIDGRRTTLAMLCKNTVARKVLEKAWQQKRSLSRADMYGIDAAKNFDAAVDACLLVVRTEPNEKSRECSVYGHLDAEEPTSVLGYREDQLVADARLFDRWKHLQNGEHYRWRSGIKHDCSKVMELEAAEGNLYRNGLGEVVELEPDCIYPMLKSSDLANGTCSDTPRRMLVTQRRLGQDTSWIRRDVPKTWNYLTDHAAALESRASSIYENRPEFSVFGVGDYSFAPWKVAIAGFYKKLDFRVVGPQRGWPVVFDDTCYFLACESLKEAEDIGALLNSETAEQFYSAFVFWDSKRPITTRLLQKLDLLALAEELGAAGRHRSQMQTRGYTEQVRLWR
jgi:hypothetical protein